LAILPKFSREPISHDLLQGPGVSIPTQHLRDKNPYKLREWAGKEEVVHIVPVTAENEKLTPLQFLALS
jgi:hypothetical protein